MSTRTYASPSRSQLEVTTGPRSGILDEMQRIAFSPVAIIGECVCVCILMHASLVDKRKRFEIDRPFFHHLVDHENAI